MVTILNAKIYFHIRSGLCRRELSGIVTGREVKNDLKESGCGGMDCIYLTKNRDRWRALVNTVTNLSFHRKRGMSWLAEGLLAPQQGLCFMELGSWLVDPFRRIAGSF
jgi:hypothetical protein